VKPGGISGIKRGDISKKKLMSLKQTVRTKILETCIEIQISDFKMEMYFMLRK
jgi:hypothetical protein